MTHRSAPKPDKPFDHQMVGPGGQVLEVHGTPNLVGAWLDLSGSGDRPDSKTLAVISQREGSAALSFIQYQDGRKRNTHFGGLPKFALFVDDAGRAGIQFVMESGAVRTISLERLEILIAETVPE